MAVAWTLVGFMLLAFAFHGWGRLTVRLLRIPPPQSGHVAASILLGWAVCVLILQIAHLGFPITAWVAGPVFIAGLASSFAALRSRLSRPRGFTVPRPVVWAAVAFGVFAVWVVSKAMYRVENFDSGLYHLQTIRWWNSYAIVPGLGNLHFRLAFNQSYFSYAAALEATWFRGHARSAANAFLLLAVVFQAIEGIVRRPRGDAPGGTRPLRWIAHLFVLPVLVYIPLSHDGITSPTPDLAATLLHISLFLIVVRAVGEWQDALEPRFSVAILPLLAATAVTVKLSTIAFAAGIVAACLIYEWRLAQGDRRALRLVALRVIPPAIVIAVWLGRGVILSGCPLYPSTAGCMSVDWAVPLEKVINERNWILSWARQPGAEWQEVLADWKWLGPWFARQMRDYIGFVFPIAVSTVLMTAAVILGKRSRDIRSTSPGWALLIVGPVLPGIAFWFFTAPDPRFGRALFWILAIASAAIFMDAWHRNPRGIRYRYIVIAVFFAINAPFFTYFATKGGARLARISAAGWLPVPEPALVPMPTTSGLVLMIPATGEKCWSAPPPCTPYYNAELSLRGQSLQAGFRNQSRLGGGPPTRPPGE